MSKPNESKPNKDKLAGPFSVYKNEYGKRFLRYAVGTDERISKCLQVVPPSYLWYMVEWINEVLTNEETNSP